MDGFDSIWLADHLMYRNPGEPTRGVWECWTILAALAEATRRVEIGTLVLCNSFRHPAILAKMATAADEVSRGRLILGVGAGWNEPEYDAFGLPFDRRVDRLAEALQILRPLLRERHVDFRGRYYQARDCDNAPAGPRPAASTALIKRALRSLLLPGRRTLSTATSDVRFGVSQPGDEQAQMRHASLPIPSPSVRPTSERTTPGCLLILIGLSCPRSDRTHVHRGDGADEGWQSESRYIHRCRQPDKLSPRRPCGSQIARHPARLWTTKLKSAPD